MHTEDADQGSACAEKSTEVWLGQLSAGATSASFIAFTAITGSVRHQGRFTRASTDREVDRCNLQDDTVGAENCGDKISVTEERQAFFIQSSTLKAQRLSSYLFAGDILYREIKKGYTRRQTSTWSASAYPTRELRTAHSKP